ncbi:MAG: XdhC family protein [Planctomycetota bacterium]|nr:XdhC family protein [Planctomycetota bacterium]
MDWTHQSPGAPTTMTPAGFLVEFNKRLCSGPCVLATVMHCTGSTPRAPGAQMACGEDWLLGTVGGGAAESKVINAARKAMGSGRPTEITIDLRGTPESIKDGICGGTMLVRLDPLDQASTTNLTQASHDLAAGHAIKQHFPPDDCWYLKPLDVVATGDHDERWIVSPDPMLLIVGGGHCGVALAHAAAPLGFQIILQDERPEMAPESELPDGTIRSCGSIDQTLDSLAWHGPLYVALVTRSYQHDVQAIEHLATKPLAYAGLMGSRRRLTQVMKMLREHNVPETLIDFLDAPIGIDLPTETPEEIAISICARLIQARHANCTKMAPVDPEAAVALG